MPHFRAAISATLVLLVMAMATWLVFTGPAQRSAVEPAPPPAAAEPETPPALMVTPGAPGHGDPDPGLTMARIVVRVTDDDGAPVTSARCRWGRSFRLLSEPRLYVGAGTGA